MMHNRFFKHEYDKCIRISSNNLVYGDIFMQLDLPRAWKVCRLAFTQQGTWNNLHPNNRRMLIYLYTNNEIRQMICYTDV